jgi:hypothetical protein
MRAVLPWLLFAGGLLVLLAAAFLALRAVFEAVRGYRIRFQGRAGVIYVDRRGTVEIDGEMLFGPTHSYWIDSAKMRLLKPGTQRQIDDLWRDEIVQRIERSVGKGKLDII